MKEPIAGAVVMQSKVPAIGVVLECAVAMAGMTSPTAVTER